MKKVLTVMLLLGTLVAVAGCNTFRGVGEDVQQGGRAIEDAAE